MTNHPDRDAEVTGLAPVTCPNCGSDDWTTGPGRRAGVLGLGAAAPAFSSAVGRGRPWVHCRQCGHEWSAPSRVERQRQADADLERRFRDFEQRQAELREELARRRLRHPPAPTGGETPVSPGEQGPGDPAAADTDS